MVRSTTPSPWVKDRFSWLWLAVGTILLPFTALQTEMAIAAWLAPVFLLRFTRTQGVKTGFITVILAGTGAIALASRGMISPPPLLLAFGFVFGLAIAIPYLADRILVARLAEPARSLVFPMAVTATSWLLSVISPSGSWSSPAYSQYGLLPLVQIVSVTGIWGLTFLVSWLAPVANAVWERGFELRGVTWSAGAFAVDYQGQVLATADSVDTNSSVMVAAVPIRGAATVYSAIGDGFAYLSAAGLLPLAALSRPRQRRADVLSEAA